MTESKKHKYDIFEVLTKISTRDRAYFNNLTEEEWKPIQPLVLLKWMYGTRDPSQLYLLNRFVNPQIFEMYKHKRMLINAMMAVAPGHPMRYRWFKGKGKETSSMPTCTKMIQEYYGYSSKRANEVLSLLSDEDMLDIAIELGRQPDEIRLIKKECKTRV